MVGAIADAVLFEAAEVEGGGNQGPEMWDVGDDDGGGRFACVPVQIDQGTEGGGKVRNSIQDST